MGDITSQLGQLFAQSIPTVIIVSLLLFILDRLFFRPLSKVLEARVQATTGALAHAREQTAAAEEKSREYERAILAVRQNIYRQQDAARRDALTERDNTIRKAREQADVMLKEAQAGITAEVAAAKVDLRQAIESLAVEISDRLLTPSLAQDRQGES